jgi:hypothetical protein
MTYTFARVGAVVALNVEDYYAQKKRRWLRLREKNGKLNEMPCHHKLETYLDAYIEAAGISEDRKGPLFRAALGKTKKARSGARDAHCCLENGPTLGRRRRHRNRDWLPHFPRDRHHRLSDEPRSHGSRAAHGRSLKNAKTTGLYDRRNDDISVGEVERIRV